MILLLGVLWLWLVPVAHAQAGPVAAKAPWYAGMPVADVRLASPEGALPEENLEPLLRVLQGKPLDLQDMRLDLVTLYRVGEFSAVEADVQPWVVTNDAGNLVPGVLLTYVVHPAPIVKGVSVQGNEVLKKRDVLRQARVDIGEPFYQELDGPTVEGRLVKWMHAHGFPDGSVEVETKPVPKTSDVQVVLHVTEGKPVIVDRVEFAGTFPVRKRTLLRWARHAGVKIGKPLSTTAITDAQATIRRKLANLGGLVQPDRGYVSARVTPAVTTDEHGETLVAYTIEPGARLDLDVTGLSWRPRTKAREAIGIDERTRLTRGFLEAAPEKMETWLKRRGFYAAQVEVRLDKDPSGTRQTLHVAVDRGPPYVLHKIVFEGNKAIDSTTLRTVMDQASQDVVRLGKATEPELQIGVSAIADVYRSRGYLDVNARLVAIRVAKNLREINPKGHPPLGRVLLRPFQPQARFLIPEVDIHEGDLTRLVDLEIEGAANDVDLSFFDQKRAQLQGGPYSPQALQALSRQVIEAHREAGYLEADARVVKAPVGDHTMKAILEVDAGPLVRLRSIVIRGARVTRPRTIRREVPIELGQPVTSTDLDELRRSLYDLDIFRTVSIQLIGDEAARDLVIHTDERPLWAFELGGGLATDQGIRGFGRITRRNLWGVGHRLDLYGLIGLTWLGSSVTNWTPNLLNPDWRVALSYTAPRFPWRKTQVVGDLLLRERLQERTYQISRSGGGLTLDTRFGKGVELRTSARLENRQLEEVDTGALLPGEVWTHLIDTKYPSLPSPGRWQGSVQALFLYDLRDNPLQPTKGLFLSLLAEWAPSFKTPGDPWTVSFVKGEAHMSAYVPLGGPRLRLSWEASFGVPLNGGILPLEDRYRLGGTGSMRGFVRDSVGPRNQVAQYAGAWPDQLAPAIQYGIHGAPTRWVETGGDTLALGIFELIVPLPVLGLRAWDGYAAAVFADVGNTWLVSPGAKQAATSDQNPWATLYHPLVRYGVGIGLRVTTPVGPLQVDLAANPEVIGATGAVKTLLKDEWGEPPVRFHLSLGTL